MKGEQRKPKSCEVGRWSQKPCWGEVESVTLSGAGGEGVGKPVRNGMPLCQYHYRFELMEWGVGSFLKRYPLAVVQGAGDGRQAKATDAEFAADAMDETDNHLRPTSPEILEALVNTGLWDAPVGGYQPRPDYSHLKSASIDLNDAALTDKQLTAVCLVFYGGLKKKKAAQVMRISSQALADHIKAALKKIEERIR